MPRATGVIGRGRGIYRPEFVKLVRQYGRRMMGVNAIAREFDVTESGIRKWFRTKPDFYVAYQVGRVEASLLKECIGYEYEEEVWVGGSKGHRVKLKKWARPQVSAQTFFLKNMDASRWNERTRVEHVGAPSITINTAHEFSQQLLKADGVTVNVVKQDAGLEEFKSRVPVEEVKEGVEEEVDVESSND